MGHKHDGRVVMDQEAKDMRLHLIAHEIDHIVGGLDVKPDDVGFLLDYVCAGYDQNGRRIERSVGLELQMRCRDCDGMSEDCRDSCDIARAARE